MKKYILQSCLLAAALSAGPAFAVTYQVYNATDFNNLPALNSGDSVLMHDGNYGALDKTLVSNITDDTTAQTYPVVVYARTPGLVKVTAPSQITLQGKGIVLTGLSFESGSGMKDNGASSPAWIIRMAPNSRYMVVSNLRFLNCGTGDQNGHWIHANGFNHTVEYCTFQGKDFLGEEEPNLNTTVVFVRSTAEAGITTPRNHRLRYCYFGERLCSTEDNGYEAIRIGDSHSQAHNMSVTVENNVFYRAVWTNVVDENGKVVPANETEIISNKSKGNQFLGNTFLESQGQLTLRHGDACLVEGNFFFGTGSYSGGGIVVGAGNSFQGGVRIIGQDHVVRNNYFEKLRGTNARSALVLLGGEATFYDGTGTDGEDGYEAAHNAQIYNNTFVDCRSMNLGFLDEGDVMPTGVKIYNNAWQGSGTDSLGVVRNASFTPGGSGGNYRYHPSGLYGWTDLGGIHTDTNSPLITEGFQNYKRPTSSSPLLNAADTTLVAAKDIRGLNRPATAANRDIGAYEREASGTSIYKPLLRNEVGPGFDGGPAGTVPDSGVFQMSGGAVVMEAENLSTAIPGASQTWNLVTETSASGGTTQNAMLVPNAGNMFNTPSTSAPRLEYFINVPTAGSYRIHVRGRGPSGSDDSINVSINDSTGTFVTLGAPGTLGWQTSGTTLSIPAGLQRITVWMRDDGTIVDKIVVSTSATTPTGTGPAESPRI